ncbi:MAG: radical SAM protein [Thermoplasmata archaeon]
MIELEKGSLSNRDLPDGCKLCREGAKLVLFATGLCNFKCFYCPLSAGKKNRDVIYADERPIFNDMDILEEAILIDSKGAGITGGDPLNVIDRTVHYIKFLKEYFGDRYHIHLYTATASTDRVKLLSDAGLDEIRFHVPVRLWGRLKGSKYEEVLKFSKNLMKTGIEIPVLPDQKENLIKLIDDAQGIGIDFINLNELEFSETNYESLRLHHYRTKSYISSGVFGSQSLARKIILDNDFSVTVHYCSAAFKDAVQLRNRIKRRARNVAKKYEVITKDGTLLFGIIECNDLESAMENLESMDIPNDLFEYDEEKHRIKIAPWILEKIDMPGCRKYEVEEYPTYDRLEVERTPL